MIRIKPFPRNTAFIIIAIVPNDPFYVVFFDCIDKLKIIFLLDLKFGLVITFFVVLTDIEEGFELTYILDFFL